MACGIRGTGLRLHRPELWAHFPNPLRRNARTTLVVLFAFVSLSPFIRMKVLPYIDWALAILLLAVFSGEIIRTPLKPLAPILLFPMLLVLAILLSSLAAPDPAFGIDYTLKVGLTWFVLFPFLIGCRACCESILRVGGMLLVANAGMLVAGIAGFHKLAWIGAVERWETLLCPVSLLTNLPAGFVIYSFGMVVLPGRRIVGLVLLISSIVILILGGGRTSLIITAAELLCAGLICLVYLLPSTRVSIGKLFKVGTIAAGVLLVVVPAASLVSVDFLAEGRMVPKRILGLLPSADLSVTDWLSRQGEERIEMYQLATAKILRSPLWGTGPHTTELNGMAVHNGYLQAWCDLGLLGFIGFAGLYFQFSLYFHRACKKLALAKPKERLWLIQSISYVACFPLMSLFNTFSTELSDLTLFLAEAALFYSFAGPPVPKSERDAPVCSV
jgi:O-antigen ligase